MNEFGSIYYQEDLDHLIQNHTLSLLFVSQKNCSVCQSLLPLIKQVMQKYPMVKLGYIRADQFPSIAGIYSIFTAPAVLFFVEGKEYFRDVRFVPIQAFSEKVNKIYSHFY
ncbi:thioredoxin family protein [Gracilibacillus dipsosauri]|uniref:Thiol reductase thioredoxin n=1 Tax=Gracilibacillus dipsosauri TaxID=178340 RepID=A0A317L0S4_9BACI|nr:thioredoxin family protein [Gracilibacillus dipsosauri]PWU68448.1 thiol reductase thioredoxin [Gracilibacillus dipsosauri]